MTCVQTRKFLLYARDHIWLPIHEHEHEHRIFFPERAERSVRLVFVKLAVRQRVFGSSRTLTFLLGSLGNIFLVQLVCSQTVREFVNNCWSRNGPDISNT